MQGDHDRSSVVKQPVKSDSATPPPLRRTPELERGESVFFSGSMRGAGQARFTRVAEEDMGDSAYQLPSLTDAEVQ